MTTIVIKEIIFQMNQLDINVVRSIKSDKLIILKASHSAFIEQLCM